MASNPSRLRWFLLADVYYSTYRRRFSQFSFSTWLRVFRTWYCSINVVIATQSTGNRACVPKKMAAGNREKVLTDSKSLVELFTRLHETLSKASSKNDSLLEVIESSQARASESTSPEVSLCSWRGYRRGSLALLRTYYLTGFSVAQSPSTPGGRPRSKLGTEEGSEHFHRYVVLISDTNPISFV